MLNLNEWVEFTTDNIISDVGIHEITAYLASFKDAPWLDGRTFLPPLSPDFEYVWATADGRFPTRVRKYYYQMFKIRVPSAVLSHVGNLARSHATEPLTYRFKIVDQIDWKDGDFGDADSCYWQVYADIDPKRMITDNGGYAICFFDADGDGVARAWFYRAAHFWVIWNGYGFAGNPTLAVVRVIAQWLGMTYRRIRLTNNGHEEGYLYINGGIGYALNTDLHDVESYDFGWPETNPCAVCGQQLRGDEIWFTPTYEARCRACYTRDFVVCDVCGQSVARADLTGDPPILRCAECLTNPPAT